MILTKEQVANARRNIKGRRPPSAELLELRTLSVGEGLAAKCRKHSGVSHICMFAQALIRAQKNKKGFSAFRYNLMHSPDYPGSFIIQRTA